MIKTAIFTTAAITAIIISFGLQDSFAVPEVGDEVLVVAEHGDAQAIPDWVKNQFKWYVNGEIEEKTLLTSMNWMFDNNIMHLSEKAAQEMHDIKMKQKQLEEELAQYRETDFNLVSRAAPEGETESIPSTGSQIAPSQTKVKIASMKVPNPDGTTANVLIAGNDDANINALADLVLSETVSEQNEDKKFWLVKLKTYNQIGEALGDYMKDLTEATRKLNEYGGQDSTTQTRLKEWTNQPILPKITTPPQLQPSLQGSKILAVPIQILDQNSILQKISDLRENIASSQQMIHDLQKKSDSLWSAISSDGDTRDRRNMISDIQSKIIALQEKIKLLEAEIDELLEQLKKSSTDTDDYSRVKVKFPGLPQGVEGNPDRPLIIGGVPNTDSHSIFIIDKKDPSARLFLQVLESEIQSEISKAEADLQSMRNDRQLTSSQFENANQKATQYINMLSSVLKTLNEMNTEIIKNLR